MSTQTEIYAEPFFSAYKLFWFMIYLTCIWGAVDMGLTAWEIWEGEPLMSQVQSKRR